MSGVMRVLLTPPVVIRVTNEFGGSLDVPASMLAYKVGFVASLTE